MLHIFKISVLAFVLAPVGLWAQSNPKIDRPVQQCIRDLGTEPEMDENFSISFWLGRYIETCENLLATTGTGGGPQVVSLLKMENDLDGLIALAEAGCKSLADARIQPLLQEMKTIYQEKAEVESFSKGKKEPEANLFDEDEDELVTQSLSRASAKKLKAAAEKIKKYLAS
ncbi:MAG: hypothetical protein OHK0053_17890 [Microscillaceae bacterium]